MTVASVIASTGAARPGASPTAAAPAAGGTDFAAALEAATEAGRQDTTSATRPSAPNDPTALPTVSLAAMVNAFASSPNLGAPPAPPQAPGGQSVEAAGGVAGVNGLGAGGSGRGAAVLAAGDKYLGTPYLWGGTDPNVGLDCSGFVQRAFSDVGVSLPRVSADQSKAGTAVASLDQAQPGDLVYWNGSGGSPNHIGIYAGEGRMLESPSAGKVVRYRDITRTPDAIRRVV